MRKIELSKRATQKLEQLLQYLEFEWSLKVKNEFIVKLDKSLERISQFPESCPETDYIHGLRMLVLTKQTSLFYKFNPRVISIVTLFDTRMNPETLKKRKL
jgi:plasmid stabilization system protein ParE